MRVDLKIAFAGKGEREAAMGRDLIQHVIEERDAGVDLTRGDSIQIDRGRDPGFLRVANDLRATAWQRAGGHAESRKGSFILPFRPDGEPEATGHHVRAESDPDAERLQPARECLRILHIEKQKVAATIANGSDDRRGGEQRFHPVAIRLEGANPLLVDRAPRGR
jgi:hypothetical protein